MLSNLPVLASADARIIIRNVIIAAYILSNLLMLICAAACSYACVITSIAPINFMIPYALTHQCQMIGRQMISRSQLSRQHGRGKGAATPQWFST